MRGTAAGWLEACGGERTECLGFQSRASQRPSPGGVFEDLMTAVTLFSRELCATVTIVPIRCSSGLVCSCHTAQEGCLTCGRPVAEAAPAAARLRGKLSGRLCPERFWRVLRHLISGGGDSREGEGGRRRPGPRGPWLRRHLTSARPGPREGHRAAAAASFSLRNGGA